MKNCYYTYGNGCPGLIAPSDKHVDGKCKKCREFNGNLTGDFRRMHHND